MLTWQWLASSGKIHCLLLLGYWNSTAGPWRRWEDPEICQVHRFRDTAGRLTNSPLKPASWLFLFNICNVFNSNFASPNHQLKYGCVRNWGTPVPPIDCTFKADHDEIWWTSPTQVWEAFHFIISNKPLCAGPKVAWFLPFNPLKKYAFQRHWGSSQFYVWKWARYLNPPARSTIRYPLGSFSIPLKIHMNPN